MAELVVAIDESEAEGALSLVLRTAALVTWYKVGYEAYYGYGDRILSTLRDAGKSIFLDLKLHDIPNTVAAGVKAAAKLGARLLTIHTAGGRAMLSAAAAARDEAGGALRLLGVTVLTSMSADDLRDTGVDASPSDVVLARTRLSIKSRIDGVVCAVDEAPSVRAASGPGFKILCPGIRPAGSAADDQRRVATPSEAVRAGANFIVVGRPISRAPDPAAAVSAILKEMRSAS